MRAGLTLICLYGDCRQPADDLSYQETVMPLCEAHAAAFNAILTHLEGGERATAILCFWMACRPTQELLRDASKG